MTGRNPLRARNRRLALVCAGFVAGMVALSFASAPLYRIFCQVTGYGGATARADKAPGEVLDRIVTVRFNADIDPGLAWEFKPVQREVKVRLGEQALAFYRARNLTAEPIVGTAAFNVTPEKVGGYFDKLQCFCFTEQRLEAGQSAELAVSFFVDPALSKDRNMDDIATITLSYTFFRARSAEPSIPQAAEPARTNQAAKPAN